MCFMYVKLQLKGRKRKQNYLLGNGRTVECRSLENGLFLWKSIERARAKFAASSIDSSKWRFSYRTNCLELTVERRMVSKSGTIMDKTSISFPGKMKHFFLKSKITTVRHLSTVNLYLRQYQYNYPCAFRVQYINTTYKFMHNNYTIISYVRNKRQWDMHKKTINNRVTFTTRRRLFLYNSRY